MQLKIQRSQRVSITNKIIFCLDIRADYSAEEQHNIERYRIGSQHIYNSRAAQKHLDTAQAHFGGRAETNREIWGGIAKGAFSLALAKMQLSVSIASLARGHHIECKDLQELLEAEDALRNACKDLMRFLDVANTFDGSEVVISYENGEEKVNIANNAPPLLAGPTVASILSSDAEPAGNQTVAYLMGAAIGKIWKNPQHRAVTCILGVALVILFILLAIA